MEEESDWSNKYRLVFAGGLEKDYTVPLRKDFFEYNRDISNSGAFSNVRQVTKRLSLPPGAYVVVPCTWDEDEEADFFMRFFFEKGNVAETPIRQKPYGVLFAMRESLRDEMRTMEVMGIIRNSSSPYAAPVVVVKKKDGSNRVCIDYRRLNKVTVFDPHPDTPHAEEKKEKKKKKFFSKIDLSKGYWQIPVRAEDIPKTAFVTMDMHYEFVQMPFGMMNSGATLTRAVKSLLDGMDNVIAYVDDLLVHTERSNSTWRHWMNCSKG
ncbi:hypothetical protein EGW08_020889 [Elysia chlorotica]|uniref:Reverse transcriptase domain-containing protein n=1 Tax=Elysia chlorotica TaxID=188477 RepID=A0A433SQ32_ELYCH|nr:hypothetical protein EGW08_020889 [Elysia chlorotica]